jgi:hypothetical protein
VGADQPAVAVARRRAGACFLAVPLADGARFLAVPFADLAARTGSTSARKAPV